MNNLSNLAVTGEKRWICLEVNPPRGVDVEPILKRLAGQVDGVDFFNVTDCALAKMKMAALPFAAILKQRLGVEPLVNVACRDRNVIALQADLLAGWAQGVRGLVALTGDAASTGDLPEAKGVFEVNSIGLLNLVNTLNAGVDLARNKLRGETQFVSGVVVNPNARNPAVEIRRLRQKKDAGAKFALSQPVFDRPSATSFFREASQVGIPLFVGLMALKDVRAAQAVARVPGIRLSEQLKDVIAGRPAEFDLADLSLENCLQLAVASREFVCGFHVVTGAHSALALELAKALQKM